MYTFKVESFECVHMYTLTMLKKILRTSPLPEIGLRTFQNFRNDNKSNLLMSQICQYYKRGTIIITGSQIFRLYRSFMVGSSTMISAVFNGKYDASPTLGFDKNDHRYHRIFSMRLRMINFASYAENFYEFDFWDSNFSYCHMTSLVLLSGWFREQAL